MAGPDDKNSRQAAMKNPAEPPTLTRRTPTKPTSRMPPSTPPPSSPPTTPATSPSRRPFWRRLLRWLGILLLFILVLILLILGTVWFIAGTDNGFRFATEEVAKRVDGLALGNIEGNLTTGIRTDALRFKNDTLELRADGVDTGWRLGCLMTREFCLDKAVVDELYIATQPGEAPVEEPTGADIVLPEIALPINVTAKEVLVRKLRFQPPGDAPEQVLENIALSVRTKGSQVFLDNASVSYQTIDAALAGEITLQGDYPLDLALGVDLREMVPGTLYSENEGDAEQARDARVDIRLGNTVSELAIDGDVTGPADVHIEGRVEPLKKTLPATLAITSPTLGFPLDSHSQVEATDLAINVDGTLDDYRFDIGTAVTGSQVPATTITLNGRANTERVLLDVIDVNTLGGTVDGMASVSWVEGLSWLTEIDISDIDPSKQLANLAGQLNGAIRASGGVGESGDWTLDLTEGRIEGVLQDYPFTLDAQATRGTDGVLRIETLTLDNGDNRLDASGTVGDAWDIAAEARLPQLQNFLPGLAGGFNADIGLSGPLAEPSVALDANSTVLKFNDLVIQGLSLKADVARAALEPSTLNLAIGQIQVGDQVVLNTRLGLDGTRADHRLSLFADGPDATAIDLKAAGGLSDRFDWSGSLDAVDLEVPAHSVSLREPTALTWDNTKQQFAVDAHCWIAGETNLCLENRVLATADGTAVITLDRYLLDRLDPFLPAGSTLAGALGADATIKWGKEQPGGFSANVAVAIDAGSATVVDANDDPVRFTYDSLTLNADVDPTNIDATLVVSSQTMGDATVAVQLDPADEARTLAGNLELQGFRIDFLQAFLPDFDEIAGVVNASGDLSGSLVDPRFDGAIVLDQLKVSSATLPLPITAGKITTNVRGKRASIDGGLASGNDGRIAITGAANWTNLPNWRADVTLTGAKLPIRTAPLTDSLVNHEISINARPGVIRVSGNVDVPFATINVKDLPKGASTLSDDIVVVEDIEENEAERTVDPAGDLDLAVSVDISLGDDVSVDAYGLIANLTGDMNVSLRSPNPVQLGGEIRVVDGVYKQYGQNLEASGQVTFVGPVNQSALDIEAIRRIDTEEPERIAGLKIAGTVARPDITLFTEPADKSEEAILSYIVLGKDLGEASDGDANLLATAAIALGAKGGRSLGQGLANSLGIEDFALETRGNGDDTEVLVSGRLNDRLLLRYGQSVFNPTANTLYLRYDLTKKLYLEAAQGVLDQAVDLIYQFSF